MKFHVAIAVTLLVCLASTVLAQTSKKSMRAAGRVDAVTQDSITILAGGDKMTLLVDNATKVVGERAEYEDTKHEGKAEGRSPAITELVKPSDSVVVTYVDGGEGKQRATEINVRLITKQ